MSVLFSACSTLEVDQLRQSPAFTSTKPARLSVPFHAQDEYQCGPAALAMLLNHAAVETTPQQLKPLVYVPEKQGSFPLEIVAATRQFDRLPYVIRPSVETLVKEISAGNPVLVFQNLGLDWFPQWHFAVVTGIDVAANRIFLNSGTIEHHQMTLDKFERTWQRAKKWAMVAMRQGEVPATAQPIKFIKAAAFFEQQKKLDLAKSYYQSAVGRWPEEVLVLMAMANISFQTGDLNLARQYYEQSIQQNAEYAPAHNNLALVLMEQGQLDKARHHAQLAVSLGGKRIKNYQQTLSDIEQRSRATPQ